jgi:hypothetical protein
MRTMNKAEQKALKDLYDRGYTTPSLTYRRFRKRAYYSGMMGCWMVPWCNMWIGIEKDGYTHS